MLTVMLMMTLMILDDVVSIMMTHEWLEINVMATINYHDMPGNDLIEVQNVSRWSFLLHPITL